MINYRLTTIFILCLSIFFVKTSYAEDSEYPVKVEIVDKENAKYDTVENALSASCSAYIKEDLNWVYEAFTQESAEKLRNLFKEANLDPMKMFQTVSDKDDFYIVDKIQYRGAVLMIVEDHAEDGTIMKYPIPFVLENEKWKRTNKYAADEELHKYLEYIPPPTLTASTKIYPKRWSIDLHNWIKENLETSRLAQFLAEKLTILCLIKNLKDSEGTSYSVNDIVHETIRLNGIVPPQTCKFRGEEKTALVLNSEGNDKLKVKKGFDEWHINNSFIRNSRRPVMLVRFNMFKSMGTLPDMNRGGKYVIEITGRLNDEKTFKGTAKIRLKAMKKGEKKGLKNSILFNAEQHLHNWWNHEPGLDHRWKSIRDGKTD